MDFLICRALYKEILMSREISRGRYITLTH